MQSSNRTLYVIAGIMFVCGLLVLRGPVSGMLIEYGGAGLGWLGLALLVAAVCVLVIAGSSQ